MTPSMTTVKDRSKQLFFGLAFGTLVLFALFQLWWVVAERSPLVRAEAMLASVGGLAINQPLPPELENMELEGIPGGNGPIRLADLRGKTIFLNFWATWCEPCIRELPSMLTLSKQMRRSEFAMVALSYDESWKPVLDFFDKWMGGVPPEFILVRDGRKEAEMMRVLLGTEKLPETLVIRDGMIVHKFISNHDWADPRKLRYFRLMTQGASP
jgi:cytochrome c biogenesis protein CcmG/thiol:disulfide interchange protein DsbE